MPRILARFFTSRLCPQVTAAGVELHEHAPDLFDLTCQILLAVHMGWMNKLSIKTRYLCPLAC